MTLEQFLDMFLCSSRGSTSILSTNTLVRPWMWQDPYEKLLLSHDAPHKSKRWFGQCWSLTPESDSIWRNLSQNGVTRCVKIKVSIEHLKQSLRAFSAGDARFILAPVSYIDKNDIDIFAESSKGVADLASVSGEARRILLNSEIMLLLAKRKAFESENEVRLLVCDETASAETKTWTYPFDINQYVEEVVFDPWTPEYYQKNYVELLRRVGLEHATKKVKFSNLYNPIGKKE